MYSLNLFIIPLCRNMDPRPVIDITKEFIGEIKETSLQKCGLYGTCEALDSEWISQGQLRPMAQVYICQDWGERQMRWD